MKTIRISIISLIIIWISLAALPLWGAVPEELLVSGTLTDEAGNPVVGSMLYRVRFFDSATAGVQLGSDVTGTLTTSQRGIFAFPLTVPAQVPEASEAWYELAIDTHRDGVDDRDTFGDRIRVFSVPFAHKAENADNLNGQPGGYYTNASNLSSGTIPSARLSLTDSDIPDSITASRYYPLSGGTISGNVLVSGKLQAVTINTGHGDYELYAMNQNVCTSDSVAFATVDTGQGANELYAMNQHVRSSDGVTFSTLNTGQGANELYAMDQDVRTTDDVTFGEIAAAKVTATTVTSTAVAATTVQAVTGSFGTHTVTVGDLIEMAPQNAPAVTTNKLYNTGGNLFWGGTQLDASAMTPNFQQVTDEGTSTTHGITAATLDTGQGANELYAMDQNVRTTDDVSFGDIAAATVTATAVTSNTVAATTVQAATGSFGTHTVTVGDLIEMAPQTAPAVTTNKLYNAGGNLFWGGTQLDASAMTPNFQQVTDEGTSTTHGISAATLDTGQGANELYAMDQDVRTTDDVAFGEIAAATVTATAVTSTAVAATTVQAATGSFGTHTVTVGDLIEMVPQTAPAVTTNKLYNTGGNLFWGGTQLDASAMTPNFQQVTDEGTLTTHGISAATLDTGQGANELYAMDQNVRTTDDVTFGDIAAATVTATSVASNTVAATTVQAATGSFGTHTVTVGDLIEMAPQTAPAVTTNKLYNSGGNLFWGSTQLDASATTPNFQQVTDEGNSTTHGITAATLDTGQGANELYAMDQDVRTTDDVAFGEIAAATVTATAVTSTAVAASTVQAVTGSFGTHTVTVGDLIEMAPQTAPAVTTNKLYNAGGNLFWGSTQLDASATTPNFQQVTDEGNSTTHGITAATLDTGQGANELYAMDQDVRTTDDVAFGEIAAATVTATAVTSTAVAASTVQAVTGSFGTHTVTVGDLIEMAPQTAPAVTTNKLYNAGGNLFWGGTQLDASAMTPNFQQVTDEGTSTTHGISAASLDTGQGANELYAMDQDVRTTDDVAFGDIAAATVTATAVASNTVAATTVQAVTGSFGTHTVTVGDLIEMAPQTAPAVTTNKLYNAGGNLFWGGIQLDQSDISKSQINNSGSLSFSWNDGEVSDALTVSGGTVNNDSFSAYSDLSAEGKIGAGVSQVAAGDHTHSELDASDGAPTGLVYVDANGALTLQSSSGQNLKILPQGTGGTDGQFLKTDGNGNVSWATAGGGGDGFTTVTKSADQNFTGYTLANDNALTFTMDANSVYEVEGIIYAIETTAVDGNMLMNASFPSGFNGGIHVSDAGFVYGARPLTNRQTANIEVYIETTKTVIWFDGVIATAGSGAFTLRFAQAATSGNLRVLAGSFIKYRKVN